MDPKSDLEKGKVGKTEKPYEIVIRNGRIVDGTGSPWFTGDIAIKDGLIAKIGFVSELGTKEINASGLTVTPGFINIHSHLDFTALSHPRYETSVKQGITTELMGMCGVSAAPMVGKYDLIKGFATYFWYGLDLPWNWHTMEEFLQTVEANGISLNMAMVVGHKNLRLGVIGNDARPATDDEILKMQDILIASLKEGAFGISAGMQWAPSWFADNSEYIALCKTVAEYGGLFLPHMRSEGDMVIEAVLEVVEIAKRSGVRTVISHLKAGGRRNWGKVQQCLRRLEEARELGVDIACDTQPYAAEHMALRACLPPWTIAELGVKGVATALKDNSVRDRVRDDMINRRSEHWKKGIVDGILEAAGYENVVFARTEYLPDKTYSGKSLEAIGRERGTDAYEALFFLLSHEEDVPPSGALYFMMNEEDVRHVLSHPLTMPEVDVSPRTTHPRWTGTFPRLIGKYVREEKLISLEEAIRKITSYPAQRIGLFDRGQLRPGMAADITVFDFDTITDRSTYENPFVDPEGIKYVFVNGESVVENGQHTGSRTGKVLRRG